MEFYIDRRKIVLTHRLSILRSAAYFTRVQSHMQRHIALPARAANHGAAYYTDLVVMTTARPK